MCSTVIVSRQILLASWHGGEKNKQKRSRGSWKESFLVLILPLLLCSFWLSFFFSTGKAASFLIILSLPDTLTCSYILVYAYSPLNGHLSLCCIDQTHRQAYIHVILDITLDAACHYSNAASTLVRGSYLSTIKIITSLRLTWQHVFKVQDTVYQKCQRKTSDPHIWEVVMHQKFGIFAQN